jgi:hypothetical protein
MKFILILTLILLGITPMTEASNLVTVTLANDQDKTQIAETYQVIKKLLPGQLFTLECDDSRVKKCPKGELMFVSFNKNESGIEQLKFAI